MDLSFDHDLYSQSHVPSNVVIRFLEEALPTLGWGRSGKEVVMDVGCGHGGITRKWILPLFPHLQKMVALDLLPSMIDVAKKHNCHAVIEYKVADIENWPTVQHWKGQISNLVSVHCFHWLKDQRNSFRNCFQLLKPTGEAAFIFFLEATFFAALLGIQKSPQWCQLLSGIDCGIPDSHHKKYNSLYYRKMLEDVGFEIVHCKHKKIKDVLPSDEDYRNFFTSICVLASHVPNDQREDFKNDLFQEILEHNGRDSNGLPFHRGILIEIVVRKN